MCNLHKMMKYQQSSTAIRTHSATYPVEYLQLEVLKFTEQELDCGFYILLEGSLTVACHKRGQSLQVLLHVSHEPLLIERGLLLTTIENKTPPSKQNTITTQIIPNYITI